MTTATAAWRWSDHRHPAPPPGWDGRHEISARGYATVFDTAGIILACSCGRVSRASEDTEDGGPVSLTTLRLLAEDHQRGDGPEPGWLAEPGTLEGDAAALEQAVKVLERRFHESITQDQVSAGTAHSWMRYAARALRLAAEKQAGT